MNKKSQSALLLWLACLALSTPVQAGVGESISVSVSPILNPARATYTDPASGFNGTVGYRVDLRNVGRNTNNSVRFTAQAYVTDLAEMPSFEFDSAEGVACSSSRSATAVSIDCAIGTLSSGQAFPTFHVFFKSPVFVPNGIGDDGANPVGDFVTFNYQAFFAEGGNGPKSQPRNGFTTLTAAAPVELGTPDPTLVRSVVLARGGTYFTGFQGIANPTDIHATRSIVPPLTSHTTAEILETANGGSPAAPCTANVVTCFTSQIAIPGTFDVAPHLSIRLSQAIENIRTRKVLFTCPDGNSFYSCFAYRPIPIDEISVTYVPDGQTSALGALALCTPAGGPFVPPADRPCIAARTVIYNGSTPIRYEWDLVSRRNGGYRIQ